MEDSENNEKSNKPDTGNQEGTEEKLEVDMENKQEGTPAASEDVKKINDPVTILSVEVLATGVETLGDGATVAEQSEDTQTNEGTCGDVDDVKTHDESITEVAVKSTDDKTDSNTPTIPSADANTAQLETNASTDKMEEDQTVLVDNSSSKSAEEITSTTTAVAEETTNETETQSENLESTATPLQSSTTGLSLLAQYASGNEDSDTESVVEVPLPANQDYRNKVVEIDSDTDSDSSDSDDSDVECLDKLRKTIEKRMEVDDDDEEDEDDDNSKGDNKRKPKQRIRAKGELLLEDLPPIHELKITVPEEECIELGKIHSIVDQLVLVSALPNSVLLDLDTVLFLDKGQRVLGEVFDVLGQVADPLYCIRFNTNKEINEKNIKVGDTVYVAPKTQYTQFIILSSLMNMKGSDASWENDIEPPPRFLDYSDDEQEQLAKRQLRNRNKPTDCDDPEKKARTMETEEEGEEQPAHHSRQKPSWQQRNHNQYNRGGAGQTPNNQNSYNRPPRHQSPYHQQQQQRHQQQPNRPSNHNPSSWHSNYYPQQYPVPPPNYGYGGGGAGYPPPQMPPVQGYGPPMYPMPPMGYPAPHSMPPHMRPPPGQVPPQMVPGFNMRPPTMGNFDGHHPPPPGSQ
ncbi:uncharacterized protein [Musca autumnalis]|uniref:uncharacterized protein n=1 Tax=Musca autumnalis TaxID=221902 RepID=UPI003CF6868E